MKLFFTLMILCAGFAGVSQGLPNFEFQDPDGFAVNKTHLEKGKAVIVFYFDPHCDHCIDQAKIIRGNLEKFKDMTLLWVSWAELGEIKAFGKTYFAGAKNVKLCKDHNYMIDTWFGYSEVPAVYCYNTKWERVASFNKEQTAETILKALK